MHPTSNLKKIVEQEIFTQLEKVSFFFFVRLQYKISVRNIKCNGVLGYFLYYSQFLAWEKMEDLHRPQLNPTERN